MEGDSPLARQHILRAASTLLGERSSHGFDLETLADRAGVDVATVERFFDSITQLVAEAQMVNYFTMVEPMHLVLSRVETAVVGEDQVAFWASIEEDLTMAWSRGQVEEKWGIINILHDIWDDPFSQSHFCDLLDIQFDRWIQVIKGAQRLGWIDQAVDAQALVAVLWCASVGQVITAGSRSLNLTSEGFKDFCLAIVRAKHRQDSHS